MSSALSDNSITNNGLVGVSSASQIGNDANMSVGNSAIQSSANDEWIDAYKRDKRAGVPSWLDWITGYDRQFDNAKYQQWLSDTAIQRRVADAKLAGINPLFAISPGSGADSNVGFSQDTSISGASNVGKNLTSVFAGLVRLAVIAMLMG